MRAAGPARFRLAEMLPDVVEAAKRNSADVARPHVDLLVSLSGFSPETTILAFELVEPPQLLVISSRNTKPSIDVIGRKLAGKLELSDITHRNCNPVDPLGIYALIRRAVEELRDDGRMPRAMIDITGGKKVMSAAAALAASQLDLPLCYIDSQFDPELRVAVPGTEKLCILTNPTALFGDAKMDMAVTMFGQGAYPGARELFRALSESVAEPARARFLGDLAGLYEAWCDLNFDAVHDRAARFANRLDDPLSSVRGAVARRLRAQVAFATALDKDSATGLALTFYLLGEHYARLARHDFAALFYYRTIEKTFAERLALRYGFHVRRPDYGLLDADVDDLTARYGALANQVYGSGRAAALPWRVALLESALLLAVLDDDFLTAARIKGVKALQHLWSLVDVRNDSVLAHGVSSVAEEDCTPLRARALLNLRAFWSLHVPGENVDNRIETLKFLTKV